MVLPPSVQPSPLLSWLGDGTVSRETRVQHIAHRERPGLEHLTRIACRVVEVELTRYAMFRIVHRSRNETSLLVTCAVVEPSVWLEALWDWLIQVPQLRAVFDKGKATSRRTC